MMKSRFVKFLKRSMRRSQSGQSILILALGFLALLGFVGIVTDVSLMFVRYSTLTRAVDAASIAAAGQVRRQVPFPSEVSTNCSGTDTNGNAWTTANPCPAAEAAAFARSFGNVGVAARQFVEFYGLSPEAVLIDMCFTVSTIDPGTGDLVPVDASMQDEFDELCVGPQGRNNERKLIKVTAQIESPTVFLRLLGFPEITLQASSISETAVLDVVLIMDVSESMLNQTSTYTWADEGYKTLYIPPEIGWWNYNYDNDTSFGRIGFGKARDHDFSDHTGLNDYGNDATYPSTGGNKWYYFRSELAALPASDVTALMLNATNGTIANSPLKYETAVHPGYSVSPSDKTLDVGARSYCAVAYWPYSRNFEVPNSPTNLGESRSLMKLYEDAGFEWTEPNDHWEGFVPGYNYYRCCNDPNNNGYFEDALCQPFRSARDATEQFLQRVDFLRGDRVAFVTFDKQAYLMRVDTDPGSGETFSHMIDNEQLALDTLQNYIGVRAEPSFYEPTTLPDGTQVMPWTGRSSLLGIHDYDVLNNCPFQDAALTFPYSPTSSATYSMANTTLGIPGLYNAVSSPNRLTPDSFNPAPDGNGQRMYPRNSGGYNWQAQAGYGATRSYDLWASCRGTNVGAALREGGNALLDPYTTRTNGSVWVMVLLSDGAAGASDPVFDSSVGLVTEPNDLYYPYNSATSRVTYGGLGLCPPGTSAGGQAELTQFTEDPYVFPFCSDEVPETRNFCFDPNLQANIAGEQINLYVDLNKCDGGDRVFYDVDDYARDWADWIGLVEPRGLSSSSQRNLTQLPTIFTIGFGLNFRGGTTKCQQGLMNGADVPDCLGEELLRYISDVGDNFRIDTDYQQDLLDDTFLNNSLTVDDYGPRGECEADSGMGVIDPKTTKDNCGNYYNAPDATELNRVFDDIASRMFTRLTQ